LNAYKVWRRISAVNRQSAVKPYKAAKDEALKRLGKNGRAYRLADWGWGYKEQAGNVAQKELRMVYRIDFRPKEQKEVLQYPPQIIEIEGMLEE